MLLSNYFSPASKTLLLLCIGYFIDFYDLTIFAANYATIIPDLFGITDPTAIQVIYLRIANFYNCGLICGCIGFGIVGDKLGRIAAIRISILIYSIAIFLSIFAYSIPLFTLLRFISGCGLASEFATSSVLISELLNKNKHANYGVTLLYIAGILGGMSATFIGALSWRSMYLLGSFSGLALYFLRKQLTESQLFLQIAQQQIIHKGNLWHLINTPTKIIKLVQLIILSCPFYFLISIMFVYPRFMHIHFQLDQAITLLLIGFFSGNIISALLVARLVAKYQSYLKFLWLNLGLFALVIPAFHYISDRSFFGYAVLLGLLGGGYPIAWIQLATRSYGVNLRNTATNVLTACGRGSTIGFNLLVANWLHLANFIQSSVITTIVLICIVALSLAYTQERYTLNLNYLES